MTTDAATATRAAGPPPGLRRAPGARQAPDFDAGQVTAAVRRGLGRDCDEARHVPKGFANENWRVSTDRGPVLVKIGRPGANAGKWRASARALDIARHAGVPAPYLLHADPACAELGGRIVRMQSWAEGISPVELDRAAAARFWQALGAHVAALHAIPFAAFSSRLDDSAPDFPSWSAYLAWRMPQIERRCAAAGFLDAARREHVWTALGRLARRVDRCIRPTFVHRDLHPDNLLATPAGDVAALLDFDMVEPWDAAAEWFKLEHWSFADAPERRAAFELGYGDPAARHEAFAERRRIAEALELLNMGGNGALDGDEEGMAWTLARLDLTDLA